MGKDGDSRARAIEGAERLFRTQGYAATGLTQILEVSGAPKGSFYFHFPEGKRQLARQVLEVYGARVLAGMQALAAKYSDPAGFIRALCKAMAKEMEATDWTLGCAAQNLAIELAPGDREFADALARTFAGWTSVITDAIRAAYPSRSVAARRATAILAALEGAKTLARTSRSADPFDAVIDMVVPKLRAAKAGHF
jgi:TetR/AcrR family transcriptional regulator, lmrAB and yxaGH operons repressor